MKVLLLAFTLTFIAAAQPPTKVLHVTAVREWTPSDPPRPVRFGHTYMISGFVGNTRYAAEQLFTPRSQHFVVGQDYPATVSGQSVKVKMLEEEAGSAVGSVIFSRQSIKVTMSDKSGHTVPERLDVVGAVEMTK